MLLLTNKIYGENMKENFWTITANKNDETKLWWEVAQQTYDMFPNAVPDALYQLLGENPEIEVLVTRNEMKDIQSWCPGIAGWSDQPGKCPLIFTK